MDHLAAARAGFATVAADAALKEKALANLTAWLTHADFAAYRPQLEWLIQSALVRARRRVLPGAAVRHRRTARRDRDRTQPHEPVDDRGQRPGALRLPQAAVSRRQPVADRPRLRRPPVRRPSRRLQPRLANPVLHLTSREICQYAAGVYAANGVHTHILAPDSKRYVPTPELSFTIRFLRAHGGLNMTASHNPPDDNGSKFYNELGAQPVPPEDQLMSEFVDRVAAIKHVPFTEAVRSGKVHFLEEAPHQAYIDLCRKQRLIPAPKLDEIRIVYTPLQGEGGFCAGEVLEAEGFHPIAVPEQATPDGQFTHVTKVPNPEVPECMDRAEKVRTRAPCPARHLHRPGRRPDRRPGQHAGRWQRKLSLPDRQRDCRLTHALQAVATRAGGVAAGVADRHHHGSDDGTDHPHRSEIRGPGRQRSRSWGSSTTPM